MYASWFEYNVTRPYPFRWFTPVAVIAGFIATGFFAFLTVATNGYMLQTIYATNPNITLDKDHWFTKKPWSWGNRLKPSCPPQQIPIGYQFFTSNLGFSYQLASVSKYDPVAKRNDSWPYLSYLNQNLEDCAFDSANIAMKKNDIAKHSSLWSWDVTADAQASCSVMTPDGVMRASFSMKFQPKNGFLDDTYVIQSDPWNKASMWWGVHLLNIYWAATVVAMTSVASLPTASSDEFWMRGGINYTPNDDSTDMTSYSYFNLGFSFVSSQGGLSISPLEPLESNFNNHDPAVPWSPVLTESNTWAKIMSSSLMIDLGQTNRPNILLDGSLLDWTLQHPNDMFRNDPDHRLNCTDDACNFGAGYYTSIRPPLNASSPQDQFVLLKDARQRIDPFMGPLSTKKATIFTQYTCSTPVLRDRGTLFFTILVAVLVYLRSGWALLNLIATSMATRGNITTKYCQGCIDRNSSYFPLSPSQPQSTPATPGIHQYGIRSDAHESSSLYSIHKSGSRTTVQDDASSQHGLLSPSQWR